MPPDEVAAVAECKNSEAVVAVERANPASTLHLHQRTNLHYHSHTHKSHPPGAIHF